MIVVGIKGLIGSGKSTIARYLVERHGFTRGRWAGALKAMLRAYLTYRGCPPEIIERMIEGDLKEIPTDWLDGRSPRYAMEGLGNGWGREWMGKGFWIATETGRIASDQPERVVFEDCRHSNEGDAVRRMGGRVWEVYQPGQEPQDHHTERSQRAVMPDHLIENVPGYLADTFSQVDRLVARMVARQSAAENSLPEMQEQPRRDLGTPGAECPTCWKDEKPNSRTHHVCTGQCAEATTLDLVTVAKLVEPR